jgi:hypothetical protein
VSGPVAGWQRPVAHSGCRRLPIVLRRGVGAGIVEPLTGFQRSAPPEPQADSSTGSATPSATAARGGDAVASPSWRVAAVSRHHRAPDPTLRLSGPDRVENSVAVARLLSRYIALGALAAAAGCGSGGSTSSEADAESVAADTATAAPSIAAEPAEVATPPVGRVLKFDYTDPDGWHYAGEIALPEIDVRITKDISSSPPGRARGVSTVQPVIAEPVFGPDNPGRPNGPQLEPRPLTRIETGDAGVPEGGSAPSLSGGYCVGESSDGVAYLLCLVTDQTQERYLQRGRTPGETDEALLDEIISAADGRPVTWTFNFAPEPGGMVGNEREGCRVTLEPTATSIKKPGRYTDEECGVLSASVQ